MLPPGAINEGEPVTPRPSATVLVVRGRDPWELLLMQRPGGADFAPGAYVFPGGTVHADDMGWGDEIRMAAVREVFEEVGILLARRGRRFARPVGPCGCVDVTEQPCVSVQLAADRRPAIFRIWSTPPDPTAIRACRRL